MSESEKQFQLWLEGKLSPEQCQDFEQSIKQDETLKSRLATARFIEQQVYCDEEKSVPKWDSEATFTSDKEHWWQWGGFAPLSFALSCCAIVMVIFKVNIVVNDAGLLVNFGDKSLDNNAIVEQLVEQRLKDFANEQQLVMANYAGDLKQQQQSNNLQLATYLITATRTERQQDISSFINYVNEQRDEDVLDQKIKLQRLEYVLQNQRLSTEALLPNLQNTSFPNSAIKEQ